MLKYSPIAGEQKCYNSVEIILLIIVPPIRGDKTYPPSRAPTIPDIGMSTRKIKTIAVITSSTGINSIKPLGVPSGKIIALMIVLKINQNTI